MKHDWEWRSFEACLEKVIYTKKLQSSEYLSVGKYPIVSQEEGLISGYWDNDDDIFKITKPIVIFGDHTRVLKYIDFNFVLGADGVKILQPIDDIKAKFLYYYLRWFNVPSLGYSRHYKLLKECSVPVPPLPIQEQIVAELDKVSEIIEKKKQQVKELDTLAQSIFYDMFGDPVENEKGWEVKRVIDVVKLQRGYDLPVQSRCNSGSIPIYGANGIVGYHNKSMSQQGIITGRSGSLGEVFVSKVPFWPLNTSLFSIDTHGNDLVFLLYLMRNFDLKRFKQGAGVPTLNRNSFHGEKIINVPLPLQQSFAQKVEAIERQKELITASIKEAQLLFDARMDYWFGE